MKKTIVGFGLIFVFAGAGFAQKVDSKSSVSADGKASVNKNGGNLALQSGTQIAGQLQNSLDVKKVRVGDEIVLKTNQVIKQNGKVVVGKGARLVGRVTEVQTKANGNAMSKVAILFDRLEQGGQQLPINAVITSVTQIKSQNNVGDTIDSDISANSSTQAGTRQNSSGGGLLGGVGETVGGVVNTTKQTVGGTTETVGRTVGDATRGVGGALRGIQVSQSSDTSVNAGSTLSLLGENLRLEKGTTFNLSLSEAISVNDR